MTKKDIVERYLSDLSEKIFASKDMLDYICYSVTEKRNFNIRLNNHNGRLVNCVGHFQRQGDLYKHITVK